MRHVVLLLFALQSYFITNAQNRNWSEHVEIVRDSFGVPHIFGEKDEDVGYGLAWATCEDDFKTLQWGLLAGKGMAGRSLGKDGAVIDYAVQLLRVRQTVDERYETDLSPKVRSLLDAFAAAVNRYAALHPEEVLVKKAFPASPKDIVAGYMLSFSLLSGVDKPLKQIVNGTVPTVTFGESGKGSNGLAMNSRITKDGSVFLDINSHQPLEGPLSWYEIHLHSNEGWNIMGGTFHGGCTVFHGANEFLGWAHTVNDMDPVDVFQLQPDPKKKDHYLIDGISYPLEKGKAKLAVNLSKKGTFILHLSKPIYWSKYGATIKTKRGWFSIQLGATTNVRTIEQYYRMNKSRNYSEFRKAYDIQGAAMMTTIYADRYDTIWCLSNGLLPYRNKAFDWKSTLPGNTSATFWNGFHPVSDLPQVLNPKCGYVFNANNSAFDCTAPAENPKPENYDPTMGYGTDPTNRSLRMHEMMKAHTRFDWNDFLNLKYDEHYAQELHFWKKFDINDIFELKTNDYAALTPSLNAFQRWKMERAATETDTNFPVVYKTLWYLYNNCPDEKAHLYATDLNAKKQFYAQCIERAQNELQRDFGRINISLGELQRHTRSNVNIPVGGGPDVWRAAYPQDFKEGRWRTFLGESYIMLVRFTNQGVEVNTVSPYGASNKPNSKHYTDQMSLYAHKQTKRMTFDTAEIYRKAEAIYHPK
ncbi:MAG: penicillin acylase family protein [Chitinophagales bacterium]